MTVSTSAVIFFTQGGQFIPLWPKSSLRCALPPEVPTMVVLAVLLEASSVIIAAYGWIKSGILMHHSF